jgi:hypothetical protein
MGIGPRSASFSLSPTPPQVFQVNPKQDHLDTCIDTDGQCGCYRCTLGPRGLSPRDGCCLQRPCLPPFLSGHPAGPGPRAGSSQDTPRSVLASPASLGQMAGLQPGPLCEWAAGELSGQDLSLPCPACGSPRKPSCWRWSCHF